MSSQPSNNPAFCLEEYKAKWTYLLHIEEFDFKVLQWYFIVVAAVFAFLFKDAASLADGLSSQGVRPALGFPLPTRVSRISIFSSANGTTGGIATEYLNLSTSNAAVGHTAQKPFRLLTVFRLRYSFCTLLGAACCALLAWAVKQNATGATVSFLAYAAVLTGFTFMGGRLESAPPTRCSKP